MAWSEKILTSIRGRRLGLERMTTAMSGGAHGENEFLVGPDDFRVGVTTAESTSTNLKSHGMSYLVASSAGSSQVYTLDPPIPGVRKTIINSTVAGALVKTANSETIKTTNGSSFTTFDIPAAGGQIELQGLTTAIWVGLSNLSTASGLAWSTST